MRRTRAEILADYAAATTAARKSELCAEMAAELKRLKVENWLATTKEEK